MGHAVRAISSNPRDAFEPTRLPVSIKAIPDPLRFVAFDPAGLPVRGTHSPATLGIHPGLAVAFSERRQYWREQVLARRGGFDGQRAALVNFDCTEGVVNLLTAHRTYSDGLALRDSLESARKSSLHLPPDVHFARPDPAVSWGMSLSCYVLLPHGHALCAQRALSLAVAPGLWTLNHSEVIEPDDIHPGSMSMLLDRLVEEELSTLKDLGVKKFVGLGLRQRSMSWQLIAVVDLRNEDPSRLVPALAALQPDAETAAWGVFPLMNTASPDAHTMFPCHLRSPQGVIPDDLETAQYLNQAIVSC
ncbi:MAG: hypothetical protein V7606_5109 [Burkholderiales bacterium]